MQRLHRSLNELLHKAVPIFCRRRPSTLPTPRVESSHEGDVRWILFPNVLEAFADVLATREHQRGMRDELGEPIHIANTHRVFSHAGGMVSLSSVKVGDVLETMDGTTTVLGVVEQTSKGPHWYIPKGVCGASENTTLSPAHRVQCHDKWTTVRAVGKRASTEHLVTYVNLKTDDYCRDRLPIDTQIVVETWDGLQRDPWRSHPHRDGKRPNCNP